MYCVDLAENTPFKSSGVICRSPLPSLLPDELLMNKSDSNQGLFQDFAQEGANTAADFRVGGNHTLHIGKANFQRGQLNPGGGGGESTPCPPLPK
jgi:hypothetical protein